MGRTTYIPFPIRSSIYLPKTNAIPRLFYSHTLRPGAFFLLRTVILTWALFWNILSPILSVIRHRSARWWTFFTTLSYSGLTGFYLSVVILSWGYFRRGWKVTEPWAAVVYTLYGMAVAYHVVVPTVYWTMLAKDDLTQDKTPLQRVQNVVFHGGDILVLLPELLFNTLVLSPFTLLPLILVLTLYLAFIWVVHAFGGDFPYPWVDPAHELSAIMYPGVLVAVALAFAMMWVLHWCKERWVTNKKGLKGIKSRMEPGGDVEPAPPCSKILSSPHTSLTIRAI